MGEGAFITYPHDMSNIFIRTKPEAECICTHCSPSEGMYISDTPTVYCFSIISSGTHLYRRRHGYVTKQNNGALLGADPKLFEFAVNVDKVVKRFCVISLLKYVKRISGFSRSCFKDLYFGKVVLRVWYSSRYQIPSNSRKTLVVL